jgi:prolyl oligopeptidase
VWFNSKDGTKVPMFVVKHKDTKFDGTAPAIQYGTRFCLPFALDGMADGAEGYGGFNHSSTAKFVPSVLTFLKAYGGLYAQANIRGGGEFGTQTAIAM